MKTNTFFSLLIAMILGSAAFAAKDLTIQITKSDITCFGQANGKAELYITGGTAPYSITWSNGSNLQTIEGLKKGMYLVSVTDNKGNIVTDSVQIDMPKPISVSYNAPVMASVENFNSKMNIQINGGTTWDGTNGQEMYFVRIDGKSYYENPETITDGKHIISIEDAQGCKLNFPANLDVKVAGDTSAKTEKIEGLGTIEMIVFPMPFAHQTNNLSQVYN